MRESARDSTRFRTGSEQLGFGSQGDGPGLCFEITARRRYAQPYPSHRRQTPYLSTRPALDANYVSPRPRLVRRVTRVHHRHGIHRTLQIRRQLFPAQLTPNRRHESIHRRRSCFAGGDLGCVLTGAVTSMPLSGCSKIVPSLPVISKPLMPPVCTHDASTVPSAPFANRNQAIPWSSTSG